MKNGMKTGAFLLICSVMIFAFKPAEKSKLDYFEGSLKEALAKAKKEKKALFIEGYTSWCGWCKKLDRTTMADEGVAEYMNKNFVNLKMDMESEEGSKVAQTYRVRGYPSMLFLYHNEILLHRIDGYLDVSNMLEEAKRAQSKFQDINK